jgi:uncharacterized Fe-S cluster-containing radical SAM superfamily protein
VSIPLAAAVTEGSGSVQFLWLELTNLCNLQCVHCYAESSPFRAGDDLLEPDDYHDVLSTAADLGCKQVQFIGGEPTLNRHLPDFISHARSLEYEFVEVFTNLTRLSQPLLNCFVEHDVRVATSVYSHRPEVHDEITKKPGSHQQTMRGIDAVLSARRPLRAGVITMPLNEDHVEETVAFLRDRGVAEVGTDRVREFGRGSEETDEDSLANLCGNCAGSTLCVAPSGAVSPCIMSKAWSVGSILETPLAEVVGSDGLRDLRRRIYDQTVAPREAARVAPQAQCEPSCGPSCYPSCVPACAPSCVPSCQPSCAPSCFPSCMPACQPSR